ncbi:DnaB-like helicase N-terminal domain-containing protein [Streptomyces sp. MS19]|uniref:DnaB-like helicase N-terminal domain-containing protein n=1 Tax=Streptomyces sp. MS19 TaxID=3385972 RepID=UPI0039A06451
MTTPPDPGEDDGLDTLPHPEPAHYAEQALLGALLLQPGRRSAIDLLPGHFGNATHRAIYHALQTLPMPDPVRHEDTPVWPEAVLAEASTHARGITAAYLTTLTGACPVPRHALNYARLVRAGHTRRTLRVLAERLAHAPSVAAALHHADALATYTETARSNRSSPPVHVPSTAPPSQPAHETLGDARVEERALISSATSQPDDLPFLVSWLRPEDFADPQCGALWKSITALAHRGEAVDPVTVLAEAVQHGALPPGTAPADLLTTPTTGPADHWAERILQRALLSRARDAGNRITESSNDPKTTVQQLISTSHRALRTLASLRTRWLHGPTPGTTTHYAARPSTRGSPAAAIRRPRPPAHHHSRGVP